VLPLLDSLHARVSAAALAPAFAAAPAPAAAPARSSLWSSVFSSSPAAPAGPARGAAAAPGAGLYLWGGTGCGKTLLMDVFLACAPAAARARRVHFHEFMQRVNAKLHAARSSGVRGDPLAAVAQELLQEAWMLCFDEVQVTDVGDAMILRRLFEELYSGGLVMLATSNRSPQQLYAGGLQRDLFMPFVALLTTRCVVHHVASPTDHRLRALAGGSGSGSGHPTPWISPQDGLPAGEARAAAASVARAFEAAWAAAASGGEREAVLELPVEGQGRCLRVRRALPAARAARFTFEELCGATLYAGDYAALVKAFDCIYMEGVPVLGMGERNELRRLITLIDILYDSKVRLTASAAASPQRTFQTGEEGAAPTAAHKVKFDEVFAWDRAVSRLIEMQGEEYGT
jgi:predicted ATPase